MKALQIYKTYYPDTVGGVEQVIKTIHLETQKLGVSQSLITVSNHLEDGLIDNMPIIRFKKNLEIASCPFSFNFFKNFKKIANQYDILHFHYPWPFADFTDLLTFTNKPSLVTFHADALKHPTLKALYAPVQNRFLKKVNRIVATSEPLMQKSPVLQSFQNKCTVIPIGIDPLNYETPALAKLSEWENKIGKDFALFVGVLRHYKGLPTLLEASKYTKTPIVIAGGGPLETELKAQIENQNLTNVHLLGHIRNEDKMALYALCRMVVLPSCSPAEAFGVTLLEGLMHKKPLISTELGTGTSYVNQHNHTGFVLPPNNAIALSNAINELSDTTLAKNMGEAGYEWFLANFQSAIMGQRYYEVYQSLLK